MKKQLLILCVVLVTLAGAVLTAQAGNFCKVDSYGCTVEEDGKQIYIMFWSESARDYIMGPGSNATVAPYFPSGEMPLDPPAAAEKPAWLAALDKFHELLKAKIGGLLDPDIVAADESYIASVAAANGPAKALEVVNEWISAISFAK